MKRAGVSLVGSITAVALALAFSAGCSSTSAGPGASTDDGGGQDGTLPSSGGSSSGSGSGSSTSSGSSSGGSSGSGSGSSSSGSSGGVDASADVAAEAAAEAGGSSGGTDGSADAARDAASEAASEAGGSSGGADAAADVSADAPADTGVEAAVDAAPDAPADAPADAASASDAAITIGVGCGQKLTLADGVPLYIGDSHATWSFGSASSVSYQNLPPALIGTVGNDTVNCSAPVSFTLSATTTCYLIRQDGWSSVDLTGWVSFATGAYYFAGYDNSGYGNATIYTQTFGPGTYNWNNYSAMYACAGL